MSDDLEQSVIYADSDAVAAKNEINRMIKFFNNKFFKKHGKNIVNKINSRLELISDTEIKFYCHPYVDIIFPDFWEITTSQVRIFYSFIIYTVKGQDIISFSELLYSGLHSSQIAKCIELSQELLDKNIIVIYSFPNEKIREYLVKKHNS